ncbi:MAG TPA: SpoIIE family protein phosphatase [Phycisphaerales bacterium]|nr:SpoIIE family protein phosphatase [Phycisphaerales bacterium]HMP38576.1 SpoIIE family protein phosphatase [Phycisphaerales bacterium]
MSSGNPSDFGTFIGPHDAAMVPATDRRHYLATLRGEEVGRWIEIGVEPLVLGRGALCTHVIPDPALSKRHCSIVLRDDRVEVVDLGSSNGSYIDGERIRQSTVLPVASTLLVGNHVFRHEVRDRAEVERELAQAADLRRARSYVEALLPPRRTEGPLRLDWVFMPCATLGGDAFGCQDLPDGRIAFYIIDVCGHGAGSALHSVAAIHRIRSIAAVGQRTSPAQVLEDLNAAFDMERHAGLYLSIWFGTWNPATRELAYASAGHPPPLMLAAAEATRLASGDPPIGIAPETRYRESVIVPEPNASIVLFSDGAYEIRAAGGHRWEYEDFVRLLGEARDPGRPDPAELRDRILRASRSPRLEDDLTILVVTLP